MEIANKKDGYWSGMTFDEYQKLCLICSEFQEFTAKTKVYDDEKEFCDMIIFAETFFKQTKNAAKE